MFLSFLTALLYIILIEIFYVLNVSNISIVLLLNFYNNIIYKYITFFLITFIFMFLVSIVINKFYFLFRRKIVYLQISIIFLLIECLFYKYSKINISINYIYNILSMFFRIYFIVTLFFYSIYYINYLKEIRGKINDNS